MHLCTSLQNVAKEEEPVTVIISSGDELEEETPNMKLNYLSQADIDLVTKGQWLNDIVIHAAQQLMRGDKNLLPVGGLQNPILGQALSFEVQAGEFVQILHSGGNHWIAISIVGMEHAHVRVYDSL